jgi:hypothetical protein
MWEFRWFIVYYGEPFPWMGGGSEDKLRIRLRERGLGSNVAQINENIQLKIYFISFNINLVTILSLCFRFLVLNIA